MDQTLDMQVAALIFLGGTKTLVTSQHSGDVETTSENDDEFDDPAPTPPISIEFPNPRPNRSKLGF